MIRFACPSCQMALSAPDQRAGFRTTCPRCRQQLQVPAAVAVVPPDSVAPVAVPDAPASPSDRIVGPPGAGLSPPAVVFGWRRVVREFAAVPLATGRHVGGVLAWGWSGWRARHWERRARASQLELGRQAFENELGDAALRTQVAAVQQQIAEVQDAKGKTGSLCAKRDQLLSQLAEPLVNAPQDDAVSAAAQQVRAARTAAHDEQQKAYARRTGLWTGSNLLERCRLVAGYTLAVGLLLLGGWLLIRQPAGTRLPGEVAATPTATPTVVDVRAVGETLVVTEKPFLMLDAGGHSSAVNEVVFTPDNRYVITASMDKTVRVWDLISGETVRVYRLWIDHGFKGGILALAISPDGKYLAIGGVHVAAGGKGYSVFLLDIVSGQVERVFRGHGNTISCLAFSRDGKRLASGGTDNVLAVWDVTSGKLDHGLTGHAAPPREAIFAADGQRVLAVNEDGTTRIWSVASGRSEAGFHAPQPIFCIAWSGDGKTIATGHMTGVIHLWSPDGTLRRTFNNLSTDVRSLRFTPDGGELLFTGVGFGPRRNEFTCSVLDIASGKERLRLRHHDNVVSQGAISPDGKLAATTGGNANETIVWHLADGSIAHRFAGKGRTAWGVGWSADGQSIAWGSVHPTFAEAARARLEHSFHLGTGQIGPARGSYSRNEIRHGNRVLALDEADQLVLIDTQSRKLIRTFTPYHPKDKVRAYTWLPDGRAVVAGLYDMTLWDPGTGKTIREFIGHSGTVNGLAVSPDGRYFISASRDQTVRIWSPERESPLLSFFFAEPDWVAWTEEGIYAASPNGERLMGWHINNGAEATASYHAAAQFRRSLFHPDVIGHVVAAGSLEQAFQRAGKTFARNLNVASVLPPVVSITAPVGLGSIRIDQSRFAVQAKACSVGPHPVTALRLLVNGRPYGGAAGSRVIAKPQLGALHTSWNVELPPGVHSLSVLAESQVSRALSAPVEVTVAGSTAAPPNLYLLAVGINEYPGPMKLNYAATDADAIVRAFQQHGNRLYGKIEVKLIKDRQATRREIEQGLAWLGSKMTHQDVGVVFLSGHGDRGSDGTFYFIPVDVNPGNIAGSCLSGDLLKKRLGEIPGRLVTILDACHSGAAGERQRPRGVADDLVRDLISEDYGMVVLSSSLGREYSLESPTVKHGYFTLALVEGLSGKADANRDGLAFLTELDRYALRRVRELSQGEQTPVMAKPPTVRSFPLAKP